MDSQMEQHLPPNPWQSYAPMHMGGKMGLFLFKKEEEKTSNRCNRIN